MKQLITPKRMSYIRNPKDKSLCVFCEALKVGDSEENLIVHRGEYTFVILNLYPYTNGHLLILPIEHQADFNKVSDNVRIEIMKMMDIGVKVLKEVYNPDGHNLGANLGKEAGAGIAEHLHFHVVPRWQGDANFVSVIGETRVLPQTLEDSYKEISKAWKTIISQG
jgi:ATP adenylyltransferase